MKTIKTAIAALLIAGGTIAAFAFTREDTQAKNIQSYSTLHWFDANTDDYLGERSQVDQQAQCGPEGSQECALGYENIDEDGNPVGTPIPTTKVP